MYYNDDFSLAEIATAFSISRQGVRSVLKKGENILFEMEDKLHLAKRFLNMRTKSSEIADQLETINKEINDGDISSKIHILIKEIKHTYTVKFHLYSEINRIVRIYLS